MILGIGLDAFAPSRLARLLREDPEAAAQMFRPEELAEAARSAECVQALATLFAVKEATYKALAPLQSVRAHWREVVVRRDGKPVSVHLTGALSTAAEGLQPLKLHVATAGCGDLVVALVIAETLERRAS